MKKILFALVIALLVAGQVVLPAAAATQSNHYDCGDTYVIRWGDTLAKIASKCGTTVSDILARNPFIHNANWIYAGQVLTLTGDPVVIPDTSTGGTYTVRRGDTLGKIAARFGTTTWTLMQLNPFIWNPSLIYAGWVLRLPDGSNGYIPPDPGPGPDPYPSGRYVTVSKRSVEPGDTVKVSVYGFPRNANIDFRLGPVGEGYEVVVDGVTDEDGFDSVTLTIPDSAVEGDYWVVRVCTTEIKRGADLTSPRIRIVD